MKTVNAIVLTMGLVASGAALGFLFAPSKGSSTRKKLSKKGREYSDYASDMFDEIVDSVAHPLESAKDEADRLLKKAKTN